MNHDGVKTKYEIVCELSKEGKSSKEIAELTGIGINTVYQYKATINRSNKIAKYECQKGHNKNRVLCRTCRYRAREESVNGCDYIVINKKSRGCAVED